MGCCLNKDAIHPNSYSTNYNNHYGGRQIRNSIIHSETINLEYDQTCQQIHSYRIDGQIIQKLYYNWHCLPIVTHILIDNDQTEYQFTVTNRGIKDCNFLVGISTLTAVSSNMKMPWKTDRVVCYESHQKDSQSGIVFNGSLSKKGKGVKKDQPITVSVTRKTVEFTIGGNKVGSMALKQLFKDHIVPYVCLFEEGDRVEFKEELTKIQKK